MVLVIITILSLGYVTLILSYCYAWIKIKPPIINSNFIPIKISVIVAARNEEYSIESCINSILQQSYPADYFELIVVDDASEDGTNDKVQHLCKQYKNMKLISLLPDEKKFGKKHALTTAINQSEAELIITTDADCTMNANWLSTIVSFYQQTKAKMIVAPVVFDNEKNSFEKMQSLEFMSLIASCGAALYYDNAIMCNGANLIYTRNVFNEVNGFEDINKISSGDDVLLMYKIKYRHAHGVKFLKHKDAIVYTQAQSSIKKFIHQRQRWSSKKFNMLNSETKRVATLVFSFNLILLFLMLTSLFFGSVSINNFPIVKIFYTLFALKCAVDFFLLFLITSFFNKKKLLIYLLPEEILYIFYSVLIAIAGTVGKYEWKGRNINE